MQFKLYKELLSIDEKGLEKELGVARKYLSAISFENNQRNLKDTSQLKKMRKYIARIRTIQSSRTITASKKA